MFNHGMILADFVSLVDIPPQYACTTNPFTDFVSVCFSTYTDLCVLFGWAILHLSDAFVFPPTLLIFDSYLLLISYDDDVLQAQRLFSQRRRHTNMNFSFPFLSDLLFLYPDSNISSNVGLIHIAIYM